MEGLSWQAKWGKILILIGLIWVIIPSIMMILMIPFSGLVSHTSAGILMLIPALPAFILSFVAFMKAREGDYHGAGVFGFAAGFMFLAFFLLTQIWMVPLMLLEIVLGQTQYVMWNVLFILLISIFCICYGWLSYKRNGKRTLGVFLIALGILLGPVAVNTLNFSLDMSLLFFFPLFLNIPMMLGGILCLISPEAASNQKADERRKSASHSKI